MADNPIRKILKDFEAKGGPQRLAKSNRTFRLSEPAASRFVSYCNFKGWLPGEILDRLIDEFLDAAKADIPDEKVLDEHRVRRRGN